MELLVGTLINVPLSQIEINPLQPPVRMTDTATRGLEESIIKSGVIVPPVLVKIGDRFIHADGGRRIVIAKKMGFLSLFCLVYEGMEPTHLFFHLNSGNKAVKGPQWLTAWAKSNPLDREGVLEGKLIPSVVANDIRALLDIVGEKRLIEIGLQGEVAPNIVKAILKIQSRLTEHRVPNISDKSRILDWLIEFKEQRTVFDQPQTKQIAVRFRTFILKNQPFSVPAGRARALAGAARFRVPRHAPAWA